MFRLLHPDAAQTKLAPTVDSLAVPAFTFPLQLSTLPMKQMISIIIN
jgi:hypothetical protein